MHNSETLLQNPPIFSEYFSSLEDPRRINKGNYFYPLLEIVFLTISAVISGADSWTMVQQFGESKEEWLRKYFPFENGVPSHDVIGKFFARLDHKTFSNCFTNWISSITSFTKGEVVAIDGKTICNSKNNTTGKTAIHMVSAFAAENGLCLGQEVVHEKSNEITAIPKLLDLLEIKGCLVTIDAMGCQKDIAERVIENGADYMLMVKDNQKELKEQVEKLFNRAQPEETDLQVDAGHGRVESRSCQAISNLQFLDDKEQWPGIKTIVRIISERHDKQTGETALQQRYYISSMEANAPLMNRAVRQHWSIENKLHWSLDVFFKEDASLKKKGNSAINFNIILKLALAMLEKEKSKKLSKPVKRLTAALDDNYRDKIINC